MKRAEAQQTRLVGVDRKEEASPARGRRRLAGDGHLRKTVGINKGRTH
jgi:hypothetical protein